MSESLLDEVRRRVDEAYEYYMKLISETISSNVDEGVKKRTVADLKRDLAYKLTAILSDYVKAVVNEVNNELQWYEYSLTYDDFAVWYDELNDSFNVSVETKYVAKMLEVSESCADVKQEHEYNQCIDEVFDNVNEYYAIDVNMKLVARDLTIESYPIWCSNDYCLVGAGLSITAHRFRDVESIMFFLSMDLKYVMLNAYRLITVV